MRRGDGKKGVKDHEGRSHFVHLETTSSRQILKNFERFQKLKTSFGNVLRLLAHVAAQVFFVWGRKRGIAEEWERNKYFRCETEI